MPHIRSIFLTGTIGGPLQKETQHAGHIPSNLSRIYVQPVIENMKSNHHNPRIWNPDFETPKPGLADSRESRGMTGHKQLRTGQEKKRGINEWKTYRYKKQAGKAHLGRAI